jgi:hypothetical protein
VEPFVLLLQVILTNLRLSHSTGNQDLCYYNSLCSHYMFGLPDFNHFFSNVAYVALGLLLLVVAGLKYAFGDGISRQHDYFHALACSLVLEGVMSAMYHMCPNRHNLQFDLVFIYVNLILVLMKNLARTEFLASGNSGLSIALVSTVITTFAGLFFDNRGVMTAVVSLAMAIVAPAFSYAMYHRGEWTTREMPMGIKVPLPTELKSRIPIAMTGSNYAILTIGLVAIYSDVFVTDLVTLILILRERALPCTFYHVFSSIISNNFTSGFSKNVYSYTVPLYHDIMANCAPNTVQQRGSLQRLHLHQTFPL